MNSHTTREDLIAREIVPALGDYAGDYAIDDIYDALQAAGLVTYTPGVGFVLATDEDGNTPGFWDIVAAHDLAR